MEGFGISVIWPENDLAQTGIEPQPPRRSAVPPYGRPEKNQTKTQNKIPCAVPLLPWLAPLADCDKLPSRDYHIHVLKYSSFFLPCDRGRSKVDIQHTAGVHDRLRAAPPEFVAELRKPPAPP